MADFGSLTGSNLDIIHLEDDMCRGLGHRQTLALHALRGLEIGHGAGAWHSPATVLAALDKLAPPTRMPAVDHFDRADRMQLEEVKAMVARGVLSFRASVYEIEARIGERRRRAFYERQREIEERAPNTVRRKARAGEDTNPSRVFASLEARGLVERRAHCGPGSAVRLQAPAGDSMEQHLTAGGREGGG